MGEERWVLKGSLVWRREDPKSPLKPEPELEPTPPTPPVLSSMVEVERRGDGWKRSAEREGLI